LPPRCCRKRNTAKVAVILPQFVVFEVIWPNPLPGLADASIAALALANRYDAIVTFDQKLAKRAKNLGNASYW
jgi:rRNA-processing protein FCF1